MPKMIKNSGGVPIKIWTDHVEDEAMNQLNRLSKLENIHSHLAVMPDVHAGKGSTVGTVIATNGIVIPAAIGVDIGCGMIAIKTPVNSEDLLKGNTLFDLRCQIEGNIPVGRDSNKMVSRKVEDTFKKHLTGKLNFHDKNDKFFKNSLLQLGSLGGGNHFIEICLDENNDVWVVLHSGSRGIGNAVGSHYIEQAKGLMREANIKLEDQDLSYLSQQTKEFDNYINDMNWCQNYAMLNRIEMMDRILTILSKKFFNGKFSPAGMTLFSVNCHHNYTEKQVIDGKDIWLTRKGAVSAKKDEYGIIPGSMGTKSYIVKGLGNLESFCSCSHGAGRRMSRSKAKEAFSIEDVEKQLHGVECRKDNGIIDELPLAYKDIDVVMENQKDLVTIMHTLKQVICIKG